MTIFVGGTKLQIELLAQNEYCIKNTIFCGISFIVQFLAFRVVFTLQFLLQIKIILMYRNLYVHKLLIDKRFFVGYLCSNHYGILFKKTQMLKRKHI